MIQKKVCMIGTSSVGKTSLVARFVSGFFEDKYRTTVGVHLYKKDSVVDGTEVNLTIWDLEGDDAFQRLKISSLRGTSGYLVVADGTREITLDQVIEVQQRVVAAIGPVPFILALNKADLEPQWEVKAPRIESLAAQGWEIIRTSAKDGRGVEEAFATLSRRMLLPKP